MIVSRLNRMAGTLFFMACFGALMNPPPYIAIAIVFFLMGLVLLPPTNQLTKQQLNWEIDSKTKTLVVIVGFILIYLFVPQVETQPTAFSNRPVESTEKFRLN